MPNKPFPPSDDTVIAQLRALFAMVVGRSSLHAVAVAVDKRWDCASALLGRPTVHEIQDPVMPVVMRRILGLGQAVARMTNHKHGVGKAIKKGYLVIVCVL